jgi:AcrR family transcriptional regulator
VAALPDPAPRPAVGRPPKRLPARKRRQQLLDVALRVFAAKGYAATTMDDIAEAAGVTKPLLYQHFASKRALYLELVDAVAQDLLQAIAQSTAGAAGPRQQVEAGFAAYFRLVVHHADAFRLLFGSEAPDDPELSDWLRRVEDVLAGAVGSLIEAGLDDEHRLLLAHAVVGMAEGASRFLLTRQPGRDHLPPEDAPEAAKDLAADRLARRLADLAWAGLRSVKPD